METTLKEEIVRLAKDSNLTSKTLAKRAGISQGHLCDILKGRKHPTPKVIRQLEKALGLKRGYLSQHDKKIRGELLAWANDTDGVKGLLHRIRENQLEKDKRINLEGGSNGREDTGAGEVHQRSGSEGTADDGS